MPDGYASHFDYMGRVLPAADVRREDVVASIRGAFAGFIETREVEVVMFSNMSALDLAKAILAQPIILKALLACCNIAARAIERDLDLKNLDTYTP
ncbi:MAG: hypothetical protein Q8R28_22225, partial [Dehalococcoidia bacterium]|nr:hypothetical protein [Dehalococcoidia bacterium]